MPEYKVIRDVYDKKSGAKIVPGTIIERTSKEVKEFEVKFGTDYLVEAEKTKKEA